MIQPVTNLVGEIIDHLVDITVGWLLLLLHSSIVVVVLLGVRFVLFSHSSSRHSYIQVHLKVKNAILFLSLALCSFSLYMCVCVCLPISSTNDVSYSLLSTD